MTCQQWEEAIAFLVDGETSVAGLNEHLARCAACRELLDGLQADQRMLQSIPEIPSASRREVRRTIWRGQWAVGAVAAAMLVAGIWLRVGVSPHVPVEVKPLVSKSPKSEPSVVAKIPTPPEPPRRARIQKPARAIPRNVDWERTVAEWFPPEEKPAFHGSQSEVAMRIQTSDPDVVILLFKEERFQ